MRIHRSATPVMSSSSRRIVVWHPWCLVIAALVLWVLNAGLAHALQVASGVQAQAVQVTWNSEAGRHMAWSNATWETPLSVRSRFTLHPDTYPSLSTIYLSLWTHDSARATEPLLELIWEKDPASWTVGWQLKLRYRPHSAGGLGGPAAEHTLAKVLPASGHSYAMVTSYDPGSALLAMVLTNLTTGQVMYQGEAAISLLADHLVIGTGYAQANRDAADLASTQGAPSWAGLDTFEVISNYLPLNTTWEVGTKDTHIAPFVPGWRFERDETIIVDITSTDPIPSSAAGATSSQTGAFLVTYSNATSESVLATVSQGSAQHVAIPAAELPLGPGTLRLDYVRGDRVLLTDSKDISIGHVSVHFDGSQLHRSGNTLKGTARITAGTAYPSLPVELVTSVTQWTWDHESKTYQKVPLASPTIFAGEIDIPGPEGLIVPISIELPDERGTWEVGFEVRAPVSVSLNTLGSRWLYGSDEHTSVDGYSGDNTVRICTYNTMGFQGWPESVAASHLAPRGSADHVGYFSDALSALGCDILGVQEGWNFTYLNRLAEAMSMQVARFSTPTAYPGAIFTRFPILEQRDFAVRLPSGDVPFSRTFGAALIDIYGVPTWVVNIHAHPTRAELRRMEATMLAEIVDELLMITPNVIVIGDFNAPVDTVIHDVLVQRGFLNTMRISGGGVESTMTTQAGVGTISIDHIYMSTPLIGRVKSSRVVSDPGYRMGAGPDAKGWVTSDHLPVVADIEWPWSYDASRSARVLGAHGD